MGNEQETVAGRRPLKTRSWKFFQWLADLMARVGITPNSISVSSVVFACGAGAALAVTAQAAEGSPWIRICWIASVAFVQLRLIANMLDGMVAVEGGKKSPLGDIYNEVPDRISDTAILVGFGFAVGGNPMLGVGASLVACFVAYLRAIGASVGAGQVFAGPMAKPQRMFTITVACLYCGLAPNAWQQDFSPGFGIVDAVLWLIILGGLVTSVRRLLIIAKFLRQKA